MAAEDRLIKMLRAKKTPCVLLSDATEHAAYRIEPEITVRAFRTLHLDRKYRNVPHFCYILTFGDQNILLTADMDYTTETLASIQNVPIRATFVNPLFFQRTEPPEVLQGNASGAVDFCLPCSFS